MEIDNKFIGYTQIVMASVMTLGMFLVGISWASAVIALLLFVGGFRLIEDKKKK